MTDLASIIFSSWTITLDILQGALIARDMNPLRIDGTSTVANREKAISLFRTDPSKRILLMTFGVGAVG